MIDVSKRAQYARWDVTIGVGVGVGGGGRGVA